MLDSCSQIYFQLTTQHVVSMLLGVGHEQQASSGRYALHVALWRCLWIMVKTCAHPNYVLCI